MRREPRPVPVPAAEPPNAVRASAGLWLPTSAEDASFHGHREPAEPLHGVRRVLATTGPFVPFVSVIGAASSLLPVTFLWAYYDAFGFAPDEVGVTPGVLPRAVLGLGLVASFLTACILTWYAYVRAFASWQPEHPAPAPPSWRTCTSLLVVSAAGASCFAVLGAVGAAVWSAHVLLISMLITAAYAVEWLPRHRAVRRVTLVAWSAAVGGFVLWVVARRTSVPDVVASGLIGVAWHALALGAPGALVLVAPPVAGRLQRRLARVPLLADRISIHPWMVVAPRRSALPPLRLRPHWGPHWPAVAVSVALFVHSMLPVAWVLGGQAASAAVDGRQTVLASVLGVPVPDAVVVFDDDEDVVCPQPEDRQMLDFGRDGDYRLLYEPRAQRTVRTSARIHLVGDCGG